MSKKKMIAVLKDPTEEENSIAGIENQTFSEEVATKSPRKKRRWRFGDRSDGYKVRTLDPMSRVSPYIMARRSDACNSFSDAIDLVKAEPFCRSKVKEGYTNFTILHILLAAYARLISQRPAVNRFISGQKVYHRHDIEIAMVVKKKMTVDSPDTCVKVYLEPTDTIDDVYRKFNAVVEANVGNESESSFDNLAKIISFIPGLLLRWTVKFLNFLDYFGLLPRFLTKLSPFHGSMIITSMGSLGIKPVYHHLYDFGNLPAFISYGSKRTEYELDKDGTTVKRRYVDIKVVTDERICDGFYYASAFKLFKRYVENPELLELPPEEVFEDVD